MYEGQCRAPTSNPRRNEAENGWSVGGKLEGTKKNLQIITKTSPRRTIEVGDLSELEADDLLKNNVVTF
jgi:hypothetical protein